MFVVFLKKRISDALSDCGICSDRSVLKTMFVR